MCGDAHLAEELTQESYIRAWKKLHTFRGDSLFTTWLHRVAANVVLGHLRTSGRRPELDGVEDEDVDFPVVERLDPQVTIDLDRAISGLPPRARTVFVLHDVEGYTHEEVANMADMAVGTSKAQLSRARRLLRKVLAP
jgi:RNA polymerase sigma-70 factor (ECF subfamily)